MSYTFTIDFNNDKGTYNNISNIINKFGIPNTIIELGVFEGRTTLWMSDVLSQHNPNLKIYAIDPHEISHDLVQDIKGVKETFLDNLQQNEASNIEYINKPSTQGLLDLINQGVKAEFIYIDGDHRASTVLSDLVLAYELLVPGGVILCDDATDWQYVDEHGNKAAQLCPRMAIEAFIQCNWHNIKPLQLPYNCQTGFVKL